MRNKTMAWLAWLWFGVALIALTVQLAFEADTETGFWAALVLANMYGIAAGTSGGEGQ